MGVVVVEKDTHTFFFVVCEISCCQVFCKVLYVCQGRRGVVVVEKDTKKFFLLLSARFPVAFFFANSCINNCDESVPGI